MVKSDSLLFNNKAKKRRHSLSQYVAILVFIGLTVLLVCSVPYGFQNDDEATCIAGAHRIMFGELPLIKNWTVIQLHSFLEYLPFRIVYALNGGTEGIVLGFRYFYVAVKMLFFAAICLALRQYRYWAILCAVIFTTFHPLGFLSLTYYNVSILCAFAVGALLFFNKKNSVAALIASGTIFACCVLAEPPVILLYFLFSLSVPVCCLIRKKTGRKFSGAPLTPDVKTWGMFTVGAAAVAVVILAVVLSAADLKTVLVSAPGALRSLKYRPQSSQWEKYADYFAKTGYAANAAAAMLLAAIGVLKATGKLSKARGVLFAVTCIVFIWLTVVVFFQGDKNLSAVYLTDYKPIPLCFLGTASYLLAKKKNRRLFAFLLFGLGFAFCLDLLSRISVCTGGVVSAPAAVLLFRETLLEIVGRFRAEKSSVGGDEEQKQRGIAFLRSVVCFSSVLALLVLTVSETAFCFHARFFPSPESLSSYPINARADRGPMKGLITIPYVEGLYADVLKDMDRLQTAHPKSLFVANYMLWCNLYLDLPYATFSPDSYDTDLSRESLLYYWSLYPDARPESVYIPFFGCDDYKKYPEKAEDFLAFMQSICDCEVETGEAGYLLKVRSWK